MNGKRERAVWWTIGICNSAEICELVGLFVLYKFQQLNKIHNFGLNRDDELAVVNNMSGPQSQKIKKELHFLFKKFGLNLIIIYPVTFFIYNKSNEYLVRYSTVMGYRNAVKSMWRSNDRMLCLRSFWI